jgi:hypothetical protein
MKVPPSFEAIKRLAEISVVKDELRVSFSYDNFILMIQLLLSSLDVDADWYKEQYSDAKQAMESGLRVSALQHFCETGYFEGRLPFEPRVDESWYLEQYPDVAESIARGEVESAVHHFIQRGYQQGRWPGP